MGEGLVGGVVSEGAFLLSHDHTEMRMGQGQECTDSCPQSGASQVNVLWQGS